MLQHGRGSLFTVAGTKHSQCHYYRREGRVAEPGAKGVRAVPLPPLAAGAAQWLPVNKRDKARNIPCPERSNLAPPQRAQLRAGARAQHLPGDEHTPRTVTIWMHTPSWLETQETEAVEVGSKAAGPLERHGPFCCCWGG